MRFFIALSIKGITGLWMKEGVKEGGFMLEMKLHGVKQVKLYEGQRGIIK